MISILDPTVPLPSLPQDVLHVQESNVNVRDVVIHFVITAKLNGILIKHVMQHVLKGTKKPFDPLQFLSV